MSYLNHPTRGLIQMRQTAPLSPTILHAISKTPFLKNLKIIKKGVYAVNNEELVTEIQKNPDNSSELMYQLYEQNLPLIRKTVFPFADQEPLEDLLQQAFFGLLEAVKHYDPEKSFKFMTFAVYWIRQNVQRYIEDSGRSIRLPVHFWQYIRDYKKYFSTYYQAHGEPPTVSESAEALGLSENLIEEIMLQMQPIRSLDETIETDADIVTLKDALASAENLEKNTIDRIYADYQQTAVWNICKKYISEKNFSILEARFLKGKSQKQIAADMGLSIQRVQQIESESLKKLRLGKAKKELSAKLFIEENQKYGTGLDSFRTHNFTSSTERRILRKEEIREEIWQKYKDKIPYMDEVI